MPIVSFSSLMLAPELIRINEKPQANWVTPSKVNAIRGEFVRQCDKLDGLAEFVQSLAACVSFFFFARSACAPEKVERAVSDLFNFLAAIFKLDFHGAGFPFA